MSKSLQKKLDSGALAEYHLHLEKLTVLHEEGNKYKGLATVSYNGSGHEVPVDIVADGKDLAWEVQPGAFLFAVQDQYQKSLADAQVQMAKAASDAQAAIAVASQNADVAMPLSVAQIVAEYEPLNEKCRSGPGNDPATQDACLARNTKYTYIKASGWCWGHKDDGDGARKWVVCNPGDF